jgi:hypothetical protein
VAAALVGFAAFAGFAAGLAFFTEPLVFTTSGP